MGSISHIENGSPSTWSNDDFSFEIVVGPDRFAPGNFQNSMAMATK